MNTPNILVAGILAAASLITTASAATNVYITGSTAFRTATSNAITAVVGAPPVAVDSSATLAAYQGANAQTWSTGTYFVQTSWSGSAAGVQTVSNSLNVRFLPAAAVGNTSPDPRNTANPADLHIPDICLADCQQSSTAFNTNALTANNKVGVVTFTFAGSFGFPSGQSMTKQAFGYNFGGLGYVPISTYNGDATAALVSGGTGSSFVYAAGRDPDSGTRITALAETGFGVANGVTQWKPTVGGGQITSMVTYPSNPTINGFTYTTGSGESSGSSLRAYLTNTMNASAYQNGETGPSYLVAYLGISDFRAVFNGGVALADTGLNGQDATTRPAVALKYNGVDFSLANIKNGSYTFWGYEYCGARVASTFYNALVSQIQGTTAAALSPNIPESDMQVTRGSDGGPITSKNF